MKYVIHYGMGGGFNTQYSEIINCGSIEEAETYAWEAACGEYDGYDGSYGLQTVDDIAKENPDYSEEDVQETWEEQREGWLNYWAEEYDKIKHKYL